MGKETQANGRIRTEIHRVAQISWNCETAQAMPRALQADTISGSTSGNQFGVVNKVLDNVCLADVHG